jgi:tRNA threonylcarbamoyl adenosine modification protein YjeE
MTPGPALSLFLPEPADTDALAAVLAQSQPDPAVVHLHGDLGAGKSTLARAWLRALGVVGPIRSPTYTLVERYALSDGSEALHLDLYRIGDAGELEFLALDEADARLWLVEWPERGLSALPVPALQVSLAVEGDGRRCHLQGKGAAGDTWVASLAPSCRLWAIPEP